MDGDTIVNLWTTTRAHSDDLWMLYLALTGAVLGFSFSASFQRAPRIHRMIVATGFAAFAFANLNAMRHNVDFNNKLVAALKKEVPKDTPLANATGKIHTNEPWLMIVFHAGLDISVLFLLLVPHARFLRSTAKTKTEAEQDGGGQPATRPEFE